AASSLTPSGEGLSFFSPSMARVTMPFFGPSLAGRSNSTTGTFTFTRWAAICAPITPAPSTATFFTWKRLMVLAPSLLAPTGPPARSSWSLYMLFLVVGSLDAQPHLRAEERAKVAAHLQLLAAFERRQAQGVFAAVVGVEDLLAPDDFHADLRLVLA